MGEWEMETAAFSESLPAEVSVGIVAQFEGGIVGVGDGVEVVAPVVRTVQTGRPWRSRRGAEDGIWVEQRAGARPVRQVGGVQVSDDRVVSGNWEGPPVASPRPPRDFA